MHLRRSKERDRNRVMAIARKFSDTINLADKKERLSEAIGTDKVVVACHDDDKALGFVYSYLKGAGHHLYKPGRAELLISALCVEPGHQRKGAGKALLSELIASNGHRKITCAVDATNQAGMALLQKQGFKIFGKTCAFMRDAANEVTASLDVTLLKHIRPFEVTSSESEFEPHDTAFETPANAMKAVAEVFLNDRKLDPNSKGQDVVKYFEAWFEYVFPRKFPSLAGKVDEERLRTFVERMGGVRLASKVVAGYGNHIDVVVRPASDFEGQYRILASGYDGLIAKTGLMEKKESDTRFKQIGDGIKVLVEGSVQASKAVTADIPIQRYTLKWVEQMTGIGDFSQDEMVEDVEGEWVRWEDVQKLLKATASKDIQRLQAKAGRLEKMRERRGEDPVTGESLARLQAKAAALSKTSKSKGVDVRLSDGQITTFYVNDSVLAEQIPSMIAHDISESFEDCYSPQTRADEARMFGDSAVEETPVPVAWKWQKEGDNKWRNLSDKPSVIEEQDESIDEMERVERGDEYDEREASLKRLQTKAKALSKRAVNTFADLYNEEGLFDLIRTKITAKPAGRAVVETVSQGEYWLDDAFKYFDVTTEEELKEIAETVAGDIQLSIPEELKKYNLQFQYEKGYNRYDLVVTWDIEDTGTQASLTRLRRKADILGEVLPEEVVEPLGVQARPPEAAEPADVPVAPPQRPAPDTPMRPIGIEGRPTERPIEPPMPPQEAPVPQVTPTGIDARPSAADKPLARESLPPAEDNPVPDSHDLVEPKNPELTSILGTPSSIPGVQESSEDHHINEQGLAPKTVVELDGQQGDIAKAQDGAYLVSDAIPLVNASIEKIAALGEDDNEMNGWITPDGTFISVPSYWKHEEWVRKREGIEISEADNIIPEMYARGYVWVVRGGHSFLFGRSVSKKAFETAVEMATEMLSSGEPVELDVKGGNEFVVETKDELDDAVRYYRKFLSMDTDASLKRLQQKKEALSRTDLLTPPGVRDVWRPDVVPRGLQDLQTPGRPNMLVSDEVPDIDVGVAPRSIVEVERNQNEVSEFVAVEMPEAPTGAQNANDFVEQGPDMEDLLLPRAGGEFEPRDLELMQPDPDEEPAPKDFDPTVVETTGHGFNAQELMEKGRKYMEEHPDEYPDAVEKTDEDLKDEGPDGETRKDKRKRERGREKGKDKGHGYHQQEQPQPQSEGENDYTHHGSKDFRLGGSGDSMAFNSEKQ